jgi:LL-diaminopimelate aminotransferase
MTAKNTKEQKMVKPAARIEKIPPYLFARIDKKKAEVRQRGVDLIDFGIGDPDIPTPQNIIEAMNRAVADPKNHQYPSYEGMFEFRKTVADWYKKRFGVDLNPANEVVTLDRLKRRYSHMPWAYVDPGDYVQVPSPDIRSTNSHRLRRGTPYMMDLKERELIFFPCWMKYLKKY